MKKIDRLIFGIALGSVLPLMMFMISLAAGYYIPIDEKYMPFITAAAILTGLILDLLFLKKLLSGLFEMPLLLPSMIYIFFNVIVYGAFMGMPVFNAFMGIIAGYYIGRKILISKIKSPQKEILRRKVFRFSGLIMIMLCISSAFLALNEKTIGEELQGMLRLGFTPTRRMIIAGIISGGILLIIIQYFLTRIALNIAVNAGNRTKDLP